MTAPIELLPIGPEGQVDGLLQPLPAQVARVAQATAVLYGVEGFEPPWICYLARRGETIVGTSGFKGPPEAGRVELAYYTFADHEGQGIAGAMAAELLALAKAHGAGIEVSVQTLPSRNASHRVLEKLGFEHVETLEHPDDGLVWLWLQPT